MTDPTGLCFLSYKRERLAEAGLLVGALRDHGVPVWQDISDLPSSVTEDALRDTLRDDATASAVMLVTPEVASSHVIRRVEAPAILTRMRANDGFFALPIAAGGLDYAEVGATLGPQLGLTDMAGFNIIKAHADPFGGDFAAKVAASALKNRLIAVNRGLGSDEPLKFQLSTRAPLPKDGGYALRADLTHRFKGRHADADTWTEFLLPAFTSARNAISQVAPTRAVAVSGYVSLPVALALGTTFPALGPTKAHWIQEQGSFGAAPEVWGLAGVEQTSEFEAEVRSLSPSADDLALLISVTHDVTDDVTSSVPLSSFRAAVHVRPPSFAHAKVQLSGESARHVCRIAIEAIRSCARDNHARGTLHVFAAVPAALAFMLGQQLNTFARVQTYEHDPTRSPIYTPAGLLSPSI